MMFTWKYKENTKQCVCTIVVLKAKIEMSKPAFYFIMILLHRESWFQAQIISYIMFVSETLFNQFYVIYYTHLESNIITY